MAVFFTSDLHFFHNNIIKYCKRPFENAKEMNLAIINNWNSVVQPEDTVYVIGDVSFGEPKATEKLLEQLNGEKHLILGNHDGKKYIPTYMKAFDSVCNFKEVTIVEPESEERMHFTLCHYPMVAWNHSHHGSFHLFGHCHGTYDNPESLSFDVGIDTHPEYRPYSLNEVLLKMYERSISKLVVKNGKD